LPASKTPRLSLAFAAALACAPLPAAAAATPVIGVDLAIDGGPGGHLAIAHAVDADNACAAAGLPALHAMTTSGTVETPPGPPTYQLTVNDGGASFRLSALPYAPGRRTFDDPTNARLWLTTAQGDWSLPSQAAPGVTLHIAFGDGGLSGILTATGLTAIRNGARDPSRGPLSIHGSWQCSR
jgi:hypothetical protein